MMHDLGERRKLERQVDELMASDDIMVSALAAQAKEALDARKYDKARELANKAQEAFTPPKNLSRFLVDEAGLPSMAQARRMVMSGKVQLNGVQARKWDQLLHKGAKVTAGGKTFTV